MENALLSQLGINWELLLSQAVNFFILLVVLTLFVYKPLIQVIKKRNASIQEGLEKAKEAEARLREIDDIGKEKIKEAERQGMAMMKLTEKKAKDFEHKLQKENEEKQLQMQKDQEEQLKKMQEENKRKILAEAAELVKKTIIKTIQLSPDKIDDALIKKAVEEVNNV